MTTDAGRCSRCHSKSARVAADGFTDCNACGATARPKPTSKRARELNTMMARQRARKGTQLELPE
jgi:ribosomal protein L37AE/L43A